MLNQGLLGMRVVTFCCSNIFETRLFLYDKMYNVLNSISGIPIEDCRIARTVFNSKNLSENSH